MIKILFVCLGNICRSPALEAILRHLAQKKGIQSRLFIDSCAVTSWYVGEQADSRMRATAQGQGIKIDHIARLISPSDFEKFDLILAVNREVLEELKHLAPQEFSSKLQLATDFSLNFTGQDIPDPFYGDQVAFDRVMEMGMDVAKGILLQELREK